MKKMHTAIRCTGIVIVVFLLSLSLPALSQGADVMNDFCVTPPFIVGGVTPNLLLMIDNSASMFDLTYVDRGGYVCSGDNTLYCQSNRDCTDPEIELDKGTCDVEVRRGHYCYDQTYVSTNEYEGYFEQDELYEYDEANNYFVTIAVIAGCPAGDVVKVLPGTLLVCVNEGGALPGDESVTRFVAKGNYLNWLTASKFDVQKKILTGGKYEAPLMIEQSRGCVGRKFIKEPLEEDYDETGVNTSLGITFGIRGPKHPYSETMVSLGGTTEIDIFYGDYDDALCNDAIDAVRDGEDKQTQLKAIQLCLDYDKGKYCSLDDSRSCSNNDDCEGEAGTCDIVNDGVCTIINDGICTLTVAGTCTLMNNGTCEVSTAGVCTVDNGTCSAAKECIGGLDDGNACNNNNQCDSNVCSKICVDGGKVGAQCNNDNDCKFSGCTAGKVGSCNVDTDCDIKKCTAPDPGPTLGNLCVVAEDCNTKKCTAGGVGECAVDTDCDIKKCTAPDPGPTLGNLCDVNTECNSAVGVCTAGKPGACLVNTDCNSNPGSCSAPDPGPTFGNVCLVPTDCDTGFGVCQQPVTQQIKSTFSQSVHECYQYRLNDPDAFQGTDYLNLIANPAGCNQIYKEYKICNGGERDGQICLPGDACPAPGVCINGPGAIRPGSAAFVCSAAYTGYCAQSFDNWDTTDWVPREYTDWEACVTAKFAAFCTGVEQPPVVDPTDDPSTTEEFDNLPAIIADLGVETQLGQAIGTLTVNVFRDAAPTGLIQEFEHLIRFGAMSFNYYGSDTECPPAALGGNGIPCTKICDGINPPVNCNSDMDCPGVSCVEVADNLDGGRITVNGYIQGSCSIAGTLCGKDLDCPDPDNEVCVYSVGDHASGLINDIDGIFASTWTPFAEGFYNAIGYFAQRGDLRLNPTDFFMDGTHLNPVVYRCQKNNILLVTDGMPTADLNPLVVDIADDDYAGDGPGDGDVEAQVDCPKFAGSTYIDDLAWIAKNRKIENFNEEPEEKSKNSQTVTTHVVFNGVATQDILECNPDILMNDTAANGGGVYERAEDPEQLEFALRQSFLMISGRAASGTAASVLASGEGTGANLVQALFYPERTFFEGEEIFWTGSLKNLWYHIDPLLGNSSIRQDNNLDYQLILNQDYIVHFKFDKDENLTVAELFEDTDGDGVANAQVPPPRPQGWYFEEVKSLWEAGLKLWDRTAGEENVDPNRLIYTTIDDGDTRTDFARSEAAGLKDFLQAGTDAEARRLILYTRGYDKFCSVTIDRVCSDANPCPGAETCVTPFRNRTVRYDINVDGDIDDTVDGIVEDEPKVWKLGDIINATPRIVSWVPLNAYDKTYNDMKYEDFTELPKYKNRGLVLVGANDGMLHGINLGNLEIFEEKYKKAALSGGSLGEEAWAFIPQNVLPYLKYLAEPGYCHLYTVDMTPYVLDASIGDGVGNYWENDKDENSWRTIVIGGMRIGGACKDACGSVNCVETPAAGKGYSSYFALDITDKNAADYPKVLWEFSSESLGHATTGPAIVRISALTGAGIPDKTKNGRWFVVLGSGPTGPIDTDTHQFKGFSDQELKLFVLDLADGALLRTIDSGIPNAFAGSMVEATIDYNQNDPPNESNYQDDALYFGFVKAEVAATKWNEGGVLRLVTNNDLNPGNWDLTTFFEGGPVTSAVSKLQDFRNHKAFLFWGEGRYFYKIADVIDDATTVRRIYGVREPCFNENGFNSDVTCNIQYPQCCNVLEEMDLDDATNTAAPLGTDGWYIDLDPVQCTDLNGNVVACAGAPVKSMAERVVTDTLATPIGAVFFTTTKPSSDVCEFGGTSHLWAVDWDTGGAVKASVLRGKAVMQVSTASIEEIDLKDKFTEKVDAASGRGRRTSAFQGVPPAGSPPGILVPPDPVNKFIHIYEK